MSLKIAVIDTNYTKPHHVGLAGTWLKWELEQSGIDESCPSGAEFLFCTVSSQQGVSALRGALRRIGNKKARVIVGGGGGWGPAVFDEVADVVCVGEGARFVRTLLTDGYKTALGLPEAWIPGGNTPVIPNIDFPWELPPLNHPDGTVRVFGSRGCRYRCLFCQTGWETSYRVNPDSARLSKNIAMMERQGRRVAIVTNDGSEERVKLSGQTEFLSMRFDNLKRLMPLTRQVVKSVRVGVEGVSERLRVAVGKPVLNAELLDVTFELLTQANGVGVRWFFIVGLPGETDADYEDLKFLVQELHKLPKGCVMMNFHAFIPQPATPLGVLPLADDYWERFDEFRRWFFHGPGLTRRVQIVAPSQCPGRLRRAKQSMAASEEQLRHGWFEKDNPNWRVVYRSAPAVLRSVALKYASRVGA